MKKAAVAVGNLFMSNVFDLLGLDVKFNIDLETLDQNYRTVQALIHPDRMIGKPEAERNTAMEQAAKVNEAYHRLKNPLHRAEEFLKAKGIKVPGQGGKTVQHPTLLMKVIEWRENLENVKKLEDLTALEESLNDRLTFIHQTMDSTDSLVYFYLELVYITKILEEISHHPLGKTHVRATSGS